MWAFFSAKCFCYVSWLFGCHPRTLITDCLPWECIYLSLVPHTWFSPGRGPLMGRIYTRVSQRWRGYFTSQVFPLLALELMALKPPFFVTVLNCRGPKPPWDALSWAMPSLGDASAWRWLKWSICWLSSLGPSRGPTMCWLWPLVTYNVSNLEILRRNIFWYVSWEGIFFFSTYHEKEVNKTIKGILEDLLD